MNKHVENTREQILNTLLTLSEYGLTRVKKDVIASIDDSMEILTWDNHVAGRHNAGKSFTTLSQYVTIYETGAYHCILLDGSIIRVYFKFNKNILVGQSLLYWPAPINIPVDDVDELGIREAMDLHLSDTNSESLNLIMRSPFRFDFDSFNNSSCHPGTHVHMQHDECRISAKKPICFNTFIRFIFLNFYPHIQLKIFDDLEPLHYSGFKEYTNAVFSL